MAQHILRSSVGLVAVCIAVVPTKHGIMSCQPALLLALSFGGLG
jgi:hypothetical protein